MRKIFLALTLTLVLSLAFGGVLVFAASAAVAGDPLYNINQGLGSKLTVLSATLSAVGESVGLGESQTESLAANDTGNGINDDGPGDDGDDGDDDDGINDGAYCRGDKEKKHPAGEKLAGEFFGTDDPEKFEAGYTEIMGWFCEGGFGFGEIGLAYRIHGVLLTTNPELLVADIFALRAEMGWGEILHYYGLEKPPKPAKPVKQPKLNNGSGANGQGNAYGHEKNKVNNGQGNAHGKDKVKDKKGKKP